MSSGIPNYVLVCFSNGRGMASKRYLYLRPNENCSNRDRKVSGFTNDELFEKAEKLVAKWYAPKINKYLIGGFTIASNCRENALKEYWRICDSQFISITQEIKEI